MDHCLCRKKHGYMCLICKERQILLMQCGLQSFHISFLCLHLINSLPFSLLICHHTAKKEEGPATGHARRCQEIQRIQVLEQKQRDEVLQENEPVQEMTEEELYSDFNFGGCRLQHQSSDRPVAVHTFLFLFIKTINRQCFCVAAYAIRSHITTVTYISSV